MRQGPYPRGARILVNGHELTVLRSTRTELDAEPSRPGWRARLGAWARRCWARAFGR